MEKELVKKILRTTNFTSSEIYKLIDIYKDTTLVNTSIQNNCVALQCQIMFRCYQFINIYFRFFWSFYQLRPYLPDFKTMTTKKEENLCSKWKATECSGAQVNGKTTKDRKNFCNGNIEYKRWWSMTKTDGPHFLTFERWWGLKKTCKPRSYASLKLRPVYTVHCRV